MRAEACQTALCVHSRPYFVAWNGVLVLAYAGFPPPLAALKASLNADADALGLRPEQFGSKWPKTTLAALDDSAPPLSLAQLAQLRDTCDKHAALLPSPPARAWPFRACSSRLRWPMLRAGRSPKRRSSTASSPRVREITRWRGGDAHTPTQV